MWTPLLICRLVLMLGARGGREVLVGARPDLCLVFQLSGRCCITTPLWAV